MLHTLFGVSSGLRCLCDQSYRQVAQYPFFLLCTPLSDYANLLVTCHRNIDIYSEYYFDNAF